MDRYDIDDLSEVLLQLEAEYDQLGWDNDEIPFFALIHKLGVRQYAVYPSGLPLGHSGDVPLEIFRLGHILADHVGDQSLAMAQQIAAPQFYGCLTMVTGIAIDPDQPLSFPPTATRLVVAVDINGVAYRVEHLDHREAAIVNSTDNQRFTGDLITEGLRLFNLAVTRHMDGGHQYGTALMDLNLHVDPDMIPLCEDGIHTGGTGA